MVTVSAPIAEALRARYPGIPVGLVLNGYDAESYTDTAPEGGALGWPVRIVYTGNLFPERDLGPLLEALRELGSDAARVAVDVVGNRNLEQREAIERRARALGVADRLRWLPPVGHAEAARAQRGADVLLAATGADPRLGYVFSGKLFEYVGAHRPILLLGYPHGVAAQLIRERGLGVVATEAGEVEAALRAWIAEKAATGRIADTAPAAVDDLSRESQARVLEGVLRDAARIPAGAPYDARALPAAPTVAV
jgi:glycosyltransferase involved in cell wall biosynthesis